MTKYWHLIYIFLKFAHICCCSSSHCGVPAFKLIHVLSLQASSDPTSDIGIVSFSSSIYISFQPRMSPSLPIFNDFKLLKLSEIFELRLLTLFLILLIKLHLAAFMTFSNSAHLFISTPQDRPIKVIYICLKKTAFSMV